jgi:hypothetical protein
LGRKRALNQAFVASNLADCSIAAEDREDLVLCNGDGSRPAHAKLGKRAKHRTAHRDSSTRHSAVVGATATAATFLIIQRRSLFRQETLNIKIYIVLFYNDLIYKY